MLNFSKKCVITGAEQRTKKDGNTYTIVHVLGDNGQTMGCMYKGNIDKIFSLVKMKEYKVTFTLNVGQYTSCVIDDIHEV